MNEIIEFCRQNNGAKTCIFPFKENGEILRLEVVNPFYSDEANEIAVREAKERLKTAPRDIAKMLADLKQMRNL